MIADHALGERLEVAATTHFGAVRLVRLNALTGGHSGLTWVAELASSLETPLRVVVKSTPPGREPVGRHDVLRQARVVRALEAWRGVPVPRIYFEDAGSPHFFAMEHIDGISEEPILQETGPLEDPKAIRSLWRQAVGVLACMGRANRNTLRLGKTEPIHTPRAELARWRATADAAGEILSGRAIRLAEQLARSAPELRRPGLVHGDFRIGNTLRSKGRIDAVIDWEIWSLGDPRLDLGWLALFTEPGAFPSLGRAVSGTPTAREVIDLYERLVGASVADVNWFCGLACFKLAAIQAHNLQRHRDGRHHDPYLERFQGAIEGLVDLGESYLASS
jgi:aminoglycoside phosphotransferase (APT) family kinase protein